MLKEGTASPVRVSRDELIARIQARQKQSPEQAVVIAADSDVRYEAVVAVLDMLQRNKVSKVGLLARRQPG
jgi:biopolymer transport protein TolR